MVAMPEDLLVLRSGEQGATEDFVLERRRMTEQVVEARRQIGRKRDGV